MSAYYETPYQGNSASVSNQYAIPYHAKTYGTGIYRDCPDYWNGLPNFQRGHKLNHGQIPYRQYSQYPEINAPQRQLHPRQSYTARPGSLYRRGDLTGMDAAMAVCGPPRNNPSPYRNQPYSNYRYGVTPCAPQRVHGPVKVVRDPNYHQITNLGPRVIPRGVIGRNRTYSLYANCQGPPRPPVPQAGTVEGPPYFINRSYSLRSTRARPPSVQTESSNSCSEASKNDSEKSSIPSSVDAMFSISSQTSVSEDSSISVPTKTSPESTDENEVEKPQRLDELSTDEDRMNNNDEKCTTYSKPIQSSNDNNDHDETTVYEQGFNGLDDTIYSKNIKMNAGLSRSTSQSDAISIKSTVSSASVIFRRFNREIRSKAKSVFRLFRKQNEDSKHHLPSQISSRCSIQSSDASSQKTLSIRESINSIAEEAKKLSVAEEEEPQNSGKEPIATELESPDEGLTTDRDNLDDNAKAKSCIENHDCNIIPDDDHSIRNEASSSIEVISSRLHYINLDSSFEPRGILKQTYSCPPTVGVNERLIGHGYSRSDSTMSRRECNREHGLSRAYTYSHRQCSFSPSVRVEATWTPTEYDRRGNIATCNRLTPLLAQRIKEELNAYKMQEMIVHRDALQFTQFF